MKCESCGQDLPTEKPFSERRVLEIANEITGRNFRVLPRGTKKTIDNFTLIEIDEALKRMASDPWHAARLGKLSLAYMLRAETIDRFLSNTATPSRGFA